MTATVKEILKLANVEKCLSEGNVESTHGYCHNACVWLILEIRKANLADYNIFLCTGTFWDNDHSWLMVQEENPDNIEETIDTVIDMTVDQFVDRPVPYSAVMTDEYAIRDSIAIYLREELNDFVLRLG